jgi:hypothetical protein
MGTNPPKAATRVLTAATKAGMRAAVTEGSHEGGTRAQGASKSGGSDGLKSREYKDAQGNVHHHTKTYEQQHGKGGKE